MSKSIELMEHSSSVVACRISLQAISAFPCPPGTSGRHNLHSYGRLNTTKMIIHKQGSDLCFNYKYLGMSDNHKTKKAHDSNKNQIILTFCFNPASGIHQRFHAPMAFIGSKFTETSAVRSHIPNILYFHRNLHKDNSPHFEYGISSLRCECSTQKEKKKSDIVFHAEYFQFAVLKINNSKMYCILK